MASTRTLPAKRNPLMMEKVDERKIASLLAFSAALFLLRRATLRATSPFASLFVY